MTNLRPLNRDTGVSYVGGFPVEEGMNVTQGGNIGIHEDITAEETGFEEPPVRAKEESTNEDQSYSIGDKTFDSKESFLEEAAKYKGKGEEEDIPEFKIENDAETQTEIENLLKSEEVVSTTDQSEVLEIFNKEFESSFGSIDELVQSYSSLKSEIDTLKQNNIAIQNQAKEAMNPFIGNEDLARQYYFMKETGIKDAREYVDIRDFDVETADPLSLLTKDYLKQNPKEDPGLVKRSIERKYRLNPVHFRNDHKYKDMTEDEFGDPLVQEEIRDEIAMNRIELRREVTPIIEKYKELKEKTSIPDFEKINAENRERLR